MPRRARIVVPSCPHHVTQRGNNRSNVFLTDGDYQQYLIWLGKYASDANVKVWSYCLMTNHVHLILVPEDEGGLARLLRPLHTQYSQFLNSQNDRSGHLWEQRYYSAPLDGKHFTAAVRYVERNPARAGLVTRPEEYIWSSARAHCGMAASHVLSEGLPHLELIDDWAGWLSVEEEPEVLTDLRTRTMRGIPCGDAAFMRRLEALRKPPGGGR